ncbi:MAG: hypothetical protein K8L97_01650 [Anaerolineae bacterium]|nr:hypothetical protein [Anaerolineae bacterium]
MNPVQPWLRQPTETAKAYHAFCFYRDLGAERSLVKVRNRCGKTAAYDRQIERWSAAYNWVARADAYDRDLDARLNAEFEEQLLSRRRKLLQQEVAHADALLAKFDAVMERVQLHETQRKTTRKKDADGKEVEIVLVEVNIEGLRELTQWRRDLAEFARLTIGLPGRISQGQHTGKDGGPLKIEWVDPLGEDEDTGIGTDPFPATD